MTTKKILLYGTGALVLGAVTFFVWSFFQKTTLPVVQNNLPLPADNTPSLNANQTSTNSGGVAFNSTPASIQPITTPNIQSDLDWLMQNSIKP